MLVYIVIYQEPDYIYIEEVYASKEDADKKADQIRENIKDYNYKSVRVEEHYMY